MFFKKFQTERKPLSLKSLDLYAKEENKAKVSLNKDVIFQFEPCGSKSIFTRFCSESTINLVKKLPIALNRFNSSSSKVYYIGIFNNIYLI